MKPDAQAFDVYSCPLQGTRLIEASAGTGKTWTLCGLVLRLLLERALPVSDILVVTFTNAATAELRERIRTRIADALARLRGQGPQQPDPFVDTLLDKLRDQHGMSDKDMALRLDLALQSFDEASILTIHGFCQRALAEAPFSTGMPLQQTLLADDSELRLQVVHDFWRRRIAGEGLTPDLAAHLLDRQDTPQRLDAVLKRRLAKPLSRWLWPDALDVPVDVPDVANRDAAFAEAQRLWQAQHEAIVGLVQDVQPRLSQSSHSPKAVDTALRSWATLLALPLGPDRLDPQAKLDLLGCDRLRAKKGLAPVPEHAFFQVAQQLIDACNARAQALSLQRLQLLRELVEHGPHALRQVKREQRVQGFDDMLLDLHQRLLAPDGAALAAALRRRFAAALVDEFQDTDPLQYAIFDAIYRGSGAPLFLVGDPKQAIYSFRNADLHTYLRARADALSDHTLDQNQRSSEALIAALNGLFGRNPQAFMLDGLHYQPVRYGAKPRQPLHEAAQPSRAALQLWRLPRDADGQPLQRAEAMRLALAACAGEIARLLAAARDGQARLGDRPLAAGDMAVLVRSHAQGTAMRRALAAVGVGSVELSQASVFDSADAADLERLLAAMLEPQREPLLRAALATEAMGRDAAALQALATDEAGLLDCMSRFAGYRELWLARGIGRMLRDWMRAEDVAARLLRRPDGERRLTNLMHLAELLHEAAANHAGPEALLRWLRQQRSDERRDDATQLRLESDRNLVQVVTIHKSKGLEYPLVFCPLLWDGQQRGDSRGEGLEYQLDGQAVVDLRELDKEQLKQVKERQSLEAAAETMRLIYVALTRAVHRCTLVVGPYLSRNGGTISATASCRARLNWLVAGTGLSPAQWLQNKLTAEQIDDAWTALAQAHAPQVALAPLPLHAAVVAPPPAATDRLAALQLPRPLPAPWWIGSYSSLAHGARHEGAAVDHDQRALATAQAIAEPPVDADDILRFPRGAVAGECLHDVFERIDFADADGWSAAVAATLRRFAPALPHEADSTMWPRMLLRMLHDVMHTPLPGGLRLAEVPASRKQAELEFHLPSHRLDAAALQRLLRRAGQAVPALQFGTLDGYLRGFIDLVFEHAGRYYLIDWKSNHLGDAPQDYAPDALERTMVQHGYHLQALLYALALHRHLRQRLPGYRFDAHFGGVLYLFVRGVRPGWTLADGRVAGVHAQRPTLQLLDELSALFDGEGATA
jgi:exodeoxyribonuclease V beta subunit